MDLNIGVDTIVSVAGIVIPLVASIIWLARKLDRIEANTEPIKTIMETMIRLDERTLALTKLGGTVVVTLKNLGTVTVSAQPFTRPATTRYILQFGKSFKFEALGAIVKDSLLQAREKEMFGGQLATTLTIAPNQLVVTVPSTDAKLCSEYMSFYLKWLDSEFFARANEALANYENIKVE